MPAAGALAFRTSLFRARDGGFILLVNKQMQKGAGVTRGSVAEVVLEPDLEERPAATPTELEKLLRQSRGLKRFHDGLSGSMRKAIADLVQQPRSAEARAGGRSCGERMMLAMEGERITPPILEAAFQRQPKAREAWRAMTPVAAAEPAAGHLLLPEPGIAAEAGAEGDRRGDTDRREEGGARLERLRTPHEGGGGFAGTRQCAMSNR